MSDLKQAVERLEEASRSSYEAATEYESAPAWAIQASVRRRYADDLRLVLSALSKAEAELDILRKAGVVELAASNPNVMSYCREWESRAEKAEAERDLLAAECRAWRAEHATYPGGDGYVTSGFVRDDACAATDAAGVLEEGK